MHNTTGLRSCTVESRKQRFCGLPSIADAPFPICSHHATTLFRFMADALDHADDLTRILVGLEEIDEARASRFRAERRSSAKGLVYYLLIDGLVKIGYTANLTQRLTAYPPSATLLATESGDLATESARHAQFAHLRAAGREWFRPARELQDFIGSLPTYQAA